MDKTKTDSITRDSNLGKDPGNPPSSEAGLTDSGEDQPLPNTDIITSNSQSTQCQNHKPVHNQNVHKLNPPKNEISSRQGSNSLNVTSYGGPCGVVGPPVGRLSRRRIGNACWLAGEYRGNKISGVDQNQQHKKSNEY